MCGCEWYQPMTQHGRPSRTPIRSAVSAALASSHNTTSKAHHIAAARRAARATGRARARGGRSVRGERALGSETKESPVTAGGHRGVGVEAARSRQKIVLAPSAGGRVRVTKWRGRTRESRGAARAQAGESITRVARKARMHQIVPAHSPLRLGPSACPSE